MRAISISTIAQMIGVREQTSQPLLNHLQDKQLLLLLDNFEQVGSVAPVGAELLETIPFRGLTADIPGDQDYPYLGMVGSVRTEKTEAHQSCLERPSLHLSHYEAACIHACRTVSRW